MVDRWMSGDCSAPRRPALPRGWWSLDFEERSSYERRTTVTLPPWPGSVPACPRGDGPTWTAMSSCVPTQKFSGGKMLDAETGVSRLDTS